MRYSERIAKVVIETICVGSEMQFHCDQSTSVPDFDLRYANGIGAVVEVTESVDRTWLETTKSVEDKRTVPTKKCRNSWVVQPRSNANTKNIRACIDGVLAMLEAGGHSQFPIPTVGDNSRSVEQIYDEMQKLGIGIAQTVEPWLPTHTIGILLPSRGGGVSIEGFRQAIETEANKDDNKKKLAVYSDRERHLFVYLDARNFLPWRVIIHNDPPTDGPSIPTEVTHVWVAAINDTGLEAVVWKAERGSCWQSLNPVAIPPQFSTLEWR